MSCFYGSGWKKVLDMAFCSCYFDLGVGCLLFGILKVMLYYCNSVFVLDTFVGTVHDVAYCMWNRLAVTLRRETQRSCKAKK
jgi:hypothetical protein